MKHHLPHGSHSVTRHPTNVNTVHTPPSWPVLDLLTPEKWKADLTLVC